MREIERLKGRKKVKNQDIRDHKTEVEGIIIASDWDQKGNVTEIRIQTTQEDEYVIENKDMFMNLTQNAVRAAGVIKIHRNGQKSILIKRCALVENSIGADFETVVPQTA